MKVVGLEFNSRPFVSSDPHEVDVTDEELDAREPG
jgi:hypothetical protein